MDPKPIDGAGGPASGPNRGRFRLILAGPAVDNAVKLRSFFRASDIEPSPVRGGEASCALA
jgi:hypothetical protein